jgi:hypothetical protein
LDKIIEQCFDHYYDKSDNTKNRTKAFTEKGFCEQNYPLLFDKDFCDKNFYVKGKFKPGIQAKYPELATTLNNLRESPHTFSLHDMIHLYRYAYKQNCYEWVYRAIQYDNGRFDPRNQSIVNPEIRFDLEIQEPWALYDYGNGLTGLLAIKGTIDLVCEINPTTYEICDYKTGARLNWATGQEKTLACLQDDFQLRLYHYVVNKLFPHIDNVYVTIYFINDGGPFTLFFDKSDLPKTLEMIRAKYEEIKNTEIPAQNRSWKCKSFCHFGRNTFEGTSVQPIIEFRNGQMADVGQPMTMCDQLFYCMQHRPMSKVIENMSVPGFSPDWYKPPGE